MPLKVDKFRELSERKGIGRKRKITINLSEQCPIHPSWNTNKNGRCKRYYRCEERTDSRCPAKGGA